MSLNKLKWALMSSNESKRAQISLNEPKKPKWTEMNLNELKRPYIQNNPIWA